MTDRPVPALATGGAPMRTQQHGPGGARDIPSAAGRSFCTLADRMDSRTTEHANAA